MEYSHTLLVYSDHNHNNSYISDETAANIRSYMNDNDFFDEYDGPLEYWLLKGQDNAWLSERSFNDCKNKVLTFGRGNDTTFTLEADIREMSYLFPDLIFELTVEYLDIDEYTKFYYKNGKVKTATGEVEVIYPDFDDLEWEDAK